VLMVEVHLPSSLNLTIPNLADLLCTEGLAMQSSLSDVQLYRTPDGNSEPSDDDQPYFAPPVSCDELPERQVATTTIPC